jgi:Protein of unknown function (DUF664)
MAANSARPGAWYPPGNADERELLLSWLGFLRERVIRRLDGLTEDQARWRPDGALIPLLGIVVHLTAVEWRWIEGGFRGAGTSRSEAEFAPGPEITVAGALDAYQQRAAATDATARSLPMTAPCARDPHRQGLDLRWVLVHLIHETAQHCGHADATRELLDGTVGE